MRIFAFLVSLLFIHTAMSNDISLTVDQYDDLRQRAFINVLNTTQVPMGTKFRVHGKTGTCEIRVIERINNHLVGETTSCGGGILNPGMNLAYSEPNPWDKPTFEPAPYQTATNYDSPALMTEILNRTSVFVGHNFSRQMEGNVYSDGSVRDLRGGTALSLGVKGRVYDFNDRINLAVEVGYESPRTLDTETVNNNGVLVDQGTQGYSPRLSIWSLAAQGEARIMDGMNGFLGANLSFPSLRNGPFSIGSGIGFQGGANYQVWEAIAIEGLVKITNMNLRNDLGQDINVSLAGIEIRSRYTF